MTSNVALMRSRISARLHELFDGRIDLADVEKKSPADIENYFCTRALAALYLVNDSNLSPDMAAKCITDGRADDGIDAVYFDEKRKYVYFIQSKWKTGNKGVQLSEFVRLRDGFLGVLNLKWNSGNKNLHKHRPQIERALKDIDTTVVIAFVRTCEGRIAGNIQEKINDFITDQNKIDSDFVKFQEFDLSDVANAARSLTRAADINLTVMLSGWATKATPYKAVYGAVSAVDVAGWHRDHGSKLFVENLRYVLEKSDVNSAITETAASEPQHFWYFNNGITAICDEIVKQPIGGNNPESGVFEVRKISIINGAQTVGSLGRSMADGVDLNDVYVHMRMISLDNTAEGFATSVTRSNNTQNDLNPVDFVSFDPNQERLRKECAQFGVTYTYRRGEDDPEPGSGFNIRDATVAAACASGDLRLAVSAKRYISGLWGDIKKEPYIKLFNDETSAKFLWNIVQVMRVVDSRLEAVAAELNGKERLIAVHGNRFILFCVFNKINLQALKSGSISRVGGKDGLNKICDIIFDNTKNKIIEKFPESYPGNIFKNQDRQQEILDKI